KRSFNCDHSQAFAMEKACTNLTDVVRSVHLLKFKGYSLTMEISSDHCFKS
uniref:Uncharacterized protein n=1 Tax=Triticum urartu TaxID=4572 RepID=A0A8R7R7B0_TRIUA